MVTVVEWTKTMIWKTGHFLKNVIASANNILREQKRLVKRRLISSTELRFKYRALYLSWKSCLSTLLKFFSKNHIMKIGKKQSKLKIVTLHIEPIVSLHSPQYST